MTKALEQSNARLILSINHNGNTIFWKDLSVSEFIIGEEEWNYAFSMLIVIVHFYRLFESGTVQKL